MRSLTQSLVLLLSFVLLCALVHFDANASGKKTVLLALGYTDFHPDWWDTLGFGSYDYDPALAYFNEFSYLEALQESGLECETKTLQGLRFHKCSGHSVEVLFLNANVLCPGENVYQDHVLRPYRGECNRQRIQSEQVRAYVEKELFNYDVFVYVGHARGGAGLSFLNKSEQTQFVRLNDLYIKHTGPLRLKEVVLASCDSQYHYSQSFSHLFGTANIEMHLLEGQPDWYRWVVPYVQTQLRRIVTER